MEMRANGPDDLIGYVPHGIGFHPEESVVIVPVAPEKRMPIARIDMPHAATSMESALALADVVASFENVYGRYPGGQVVVMTYTDDRDMAEEVSTALTAAFERVGVHVVEQLMVEDHAWTRLDTGETQPRNTAAEAAADLEARVEYGTAPAAHRDELYHQYAAKDPEPVRGELENAYELMAISTPGEESQWAVNRFMRLVRDGGEMSNVEIARLAVAMHATMVRDDLAMMIDTDTARELAPHWRNVLQRTPEEMVTPVATVAALAHWCGREPVGAQLALQRIPVREGTEPTHLARLVDTCLRSGADPAKTWDLVKENFIDQQTASITAVAAPGERFTTDERHLRIVRNDEPGPSGPSI